METEGGEGSDDWGVEDMERSMEEENEVQRRKPSNDSPPIKNSWGNINYGTTMAATQGICSHNWAVDIERSIREGEEQYWTNLSIYRVPDFMRKLNPQAFTPQVVSLGPFHHGAPHLRPIEAHKKRAVAHFLKRSGRSLANLTDAVGGHVEQLLDRYAWPEVDGAWRGDTQGFVQVMVVDGCFLLDAMRMQRCAPTDCAPSDYAHSDPLFSKHGMDRMMPYIRRDMLLIENQLPLLVLKLLFNLESRACDQSPGETSDDFINELVLHFCAPEASATSDPSLGLHALDLYHRSSAPATGHTLLPIPQNSAARQTIPSAVELHKAKVRFTPSVTGCGISFDKGVLTLPSAAEDATIYINMLAFEHLYVGAGDGVSSYVFFMSELVRGDQDVRLLQRKGILENDLGFDESVVTLFNAMGKEITLDPSSGLGGVRVALDEHYKKWHRRWMRRFLMVSVTTYLKRNPWKMISLVGGVVWLVLPSVSTIWRNY